LNAESKIQEILKKRGDKVRLVRYSIVASPEHQCGSFLNGASMAAHKQGRFWEMHDALFKHQDQFKPLNGQTAEPLVMKIAKDLKLDMLRFEPDLKGEKTQQLVDAMEDLAVEVGVVGTPTFFFIKPDNKISAMRDTAAFESFLKDEANWKT
jgi:protein-disulfide isomerase